MRKTTFILFTLYLLVSRFWGITGSAQEEKEIMARPSIEYKAEDFRDPFQGYLEEKAGPKIIEEEVIISAPLPSLTIQGIIWGGRFPQAIINDKVVKTGDMIEGVRILRINKEAVKIFFGGRQYTLPSPAAVNLQGLKKEPEGGKNEE